ncbi:MAG: hypothetical protein COB89_06990 [Piscirickettsiaceae bacterium]|nr:MAG: hypothetical protein COB89_06990 [Piscirickettsiaceae bacterium]
MFTNSLSRILIQFKTPFPISSTLLLFLAIVATNVSATNGAFAIGYGARQLGIAGGGSAFPQDPIIAALNPAGVVFLGEQKDVNLKYYSPPRKYKVEGADTTSFPLPTKTIKNQTNHFFIPSAGFSWPLSSKSSVGLALYANGGMNTDYSASDTPSRSGAFGGKRAGVDYAQVFTNLNYSRKFADGKASWGVATLLNLSYIRMNGLSKFAGFSTDPSNLSDNGHDYAFGVGLRVGILAEVAPGVRLGASYQTKIKNTFKDYKGLFANDGEFDVPANGIIGIAADVGSGVLTFDIQQIQFSDTAAIGNTSRTFLSGGKLGDNIGFGWDNMTIYKLGYVRNKANGWTWRVGASYGKNPVPDDELTLSILAPALTEYHFTAGFSKVLKSNKEINVAFMFAPETCSSGPSLFAPTNTVELCIRQFSLDIGLSF